MPIMVKSDRLDFVKRKHHEQMEYMMGEPMFVPVGLNGERTDLTNLGDVEQDIRDRYGLNVMGPSVKR